MPGSHYTEALYETQKKECVFNEGTLEWICPVCKLGHNGCHADWGQEHCSCGCQCPVIHDRLLDELMNYNLCGP